MDLFLKDKVCIVTGGASGIGAAISNALLQEGAIVMVIDLNKNLTNNKDKCGFIKADLTDVEACRQAVDKTLSAYGKIDAVVNNAGINDSVGLQDGDPSNFEASLKKNLFHYYYIVHYALPSLKNEKGCVVNISSKVAETGQGHTSGYAAAKGAINALTREWAAELLPHSVRVNAVVPAEVWTPLYESWINAQENPTEKLEKVTSCIPLEHRFTTPEEIASTVLFLISNRASHITGQLIHVDGGYTHLDRALTK